MMSETNGDALIPSCKIDEMEMTMLLLLLLPRVLHHYFGSLVVLDD